jgi:hypothetical protein
VSDDAKGAKPPARSEEDVVAGVLPVSVGGIAKNLRILTMAESRTWKLALVNVGTKGIGTLDLRSSEDIGPLIDTAAEKILELVVAYDVDGTLGGREWLEKKATDLEVYTVFRRCLEVSFPFVRDLRSVLAELRALGLADLLANAASRPASSGSGDSPGGASDSTPALLTSS